MRWNSIENGAQSFLRNRQVGSTYERPPIRDLSDFGLHSGVARDLLHRAAGPVFGRPIDAALAWRENTEVPSARLLAPGAFLSDTGTARRSEFVRRIHALGKQRGIQVHWVAHRGQGSHGLLYCGSNLTTVRDLKDEIDTRADHKMLK